MIRKSPNPWRVLEAAIMAMPLAVASCQRGQPTSGPVGTYSARLPGASEKLTLREDASYTQDVWVDHEGLTRQALGVWKRGPGPGYLTLDGNFLNVLDERGRLRENIRPNTNAIYVLEFHDESFLAAKLVVSEDHVYRKSRNRESVGRKADTSGEIPKLRKAGDP